MIGAIAGDIIGSRFEYIYKKTRDFELCSESCFFTDDSILTIAIADSILGNRNYAKNLRLYFSKYSSADYGNGFRKWAESDSDIPYPSHGNGSAMRVSPIGDYFDTLDDVLKNSKESAKITHHHVEGIKGAQATASAIFLAKQKKDKQKIKEYISETFGYKLDESIDSIRKWYKYDGSCQGTVPQAITSFLEAKDFEDAIRNAISIGGDSDTLACIAGSIAEPYYGIPKEIRNFVEKKLDPQLMSVVRKFEDTISKKH